MRSQHYRPRQAERTLCQTSVPPDPIVPATSVFATTASERKIESASGTPRSDSGFTLLEMLLALALCGIVMSGVYGAIHLHVQLRMSSRDRINTARISSRITDCFSTDIQSVARSFEIVEQPDNQSVQNPRFQTTEIEITEISERHLNPEGVVTVDPVHFQGTANYFVVLTGSPNPRFPQHATTSAAHARDNTGLARQIAWWFSNGGTMQLPVNIENERIRYQVIDAGHRHHSIVRAQRPVQYRSVRPGDANDEVLFSHFTDVAEDVAGMYFRYFDGLVWTDEWDSHELKRFPAAVELTVEFIADSQPPLTCVVNVPSADIVRTRGSRL